MECEQEGEREMVPSSAVRTTLVSMPWEYDFLVLLQDSLCPGIHADRRTYDAPVGNTNSIQELARKVIHDTSHRTLEECCVRDHLPTLSISPIPSLPNLYFIRLRVNGIDH